MAATSVADKNLFSTSTSPYGFSSPSAAAAQSSSSITGTSIELLIFIIAAVFIQLSITICLCVQSCRATKSRDSGSATVETQQNDEAIATSATGTSRSRGIRTSDALLCQGRCPRCLTSICLSILPKFGNYSHRAARSGAAEDIEIGNIDAEATAARYSEPPPSYDEALAMPRTTSGHVVLFYTNSNYDQRGERIVFRFTMSDDPAALPPTFAGFMTVDETGN